MLLTFSVCAADARQLTIHYHRPDADYDGWTLWSWNPATNKSADLSDSGKDDFGLIFLLNTTSYGVEDDRQDGGSAAGATDGAGAADKLGMLPKYRNWDSKDDPDRHWTPDLGDEIYLVSADKNLYATRPDVSPRVLKAMVDSKNLVRVVLSKSAMPRDVVPESVSIRDAQGQPYAVKSAEAAAKVGKNVKTIAVELESDLRVDAMAGGTVTFADYKAGPLIPGKILDDPEFSSDLAMGAIYDPARTVFRVFSPTALGVTLLLYAHPLGGVPDEVDLDAAGHGLWEATVDGDLNGRYYTYRAKFVEGEFEAVDPYARSTTAHNGRGLVFRDVTEIAPPPAFPPRDAVIYEMHIRDFTIDPASGVASVYRGKYLGLTEEGTTFADDTSISTALDHLAELGVNVVQIMPFHDFDNNEEAGEYNWGYMPVHYFSPEGWFAGRRDDATRVREVKQMVDALHRKGMKVVLDVVYNHTAEGNPNIRFSFNGLAPNYYYRTKDDGSYWNGSGCGDEFRSESPMGRKVIVDSIKYWMTEYGIDGFRFDLMGLIDLETIKEIVAEARKINPDALIYGEPWAGGSTPIRVTSKGDQRGAGFSVFNDHFRDAVKGGTFNKDPGFVQAGRDVDKIKRGIKGSIDDFAKDPVESINYIEAHDNNTLWDRLGLTTGIGGASRDDRVKMDMLAAALVLTSQGIPFIHSGQEMLRTKENEDNTYNKPDRINQIHWKWKKENRQVFEYYRNLIRMRRQHPMFRMPTAEDVRKNLFFLDEDLGYAVPSQCVGYVLNRGSTADEWANALLLFNASSRDADFAIPASSWEWGWGHSETLKHSPPVAGSVTADTVRIPARTAAVFFNTDEAFAQKYLKPALESKKSRAQKFSVKAPGASKVALAGSFNGWKNDQYFLQKQPDGSWAIDIDLAPGSYEYKFLQDGDWDKLNKDNLKMTVRAAAPGKKGSGTKPTPFSVKAPGASKVALAGSFNDWKTDQYFLEKNTDGLWSLELDLAPGAYEYKYLQDGDWDKLNKENRKMTVK